MSNVYRALRMHYKHTRVFFFEHLVHFNKCNDNNMGLYYYFILYIIKYILCWNYTKDTWHVILS